MKYDWVVVGAGFTGATFARLMKDQGKSVLVVDKRMEVGGNAAEGYTAQGLRYHKYGAHIFHTDNDEIATFVRRFGEWVTYIHRVGVFLGPSAKFMTLPFNFQGIDMMYPESLAAAIKTALLQIGKDGDKIPILKLMENPSQIIRDFANDVYQWIFLQYTHKQWGLRPEELDPGVTARVPVRIGYDDRWFTDAHQIMPRYGYNQFFERLLEGIPVLLGMNGIEAYENLDAERFFYTGPIDEFMGDTFGPLPYRSLNFRHSVVEWTDKVYQTAVTNYTTRMEQYTRIIEQRQLTFQEHPHTLLTYEYPQPYLRGMNDPYYPIPREENRDLYTRYLAAAHEAYPDIVWAGRLGRYVYLDMHQAIGQAMAFAKRLV